MTSAAEQTLSLTEICTLVAGCIKGTGPDAVVVTPDTELLLTGILDSLTVMKIVAELERSLGIDLPPTFIAAKNFRTPQTLHAAVVDTQHAAVVDTQHAAVVDTQHAAVVDTRHAAVTAAEPPR
ncbi:acyl carrier protein [Skermania piniformis]|uniref:acyl carrier protein n=1 Tax=Skermania pinensis TaxID=39122 RepID=UPI00082A23A8|nr:acyl carrier protein [Skermania piniformis]